MPKTLAVMDQMNAVDKELFYCDIRELCYEDQTVVTWRGLKRYILKEEIVNEDARRRYYVLWCLHHGFIVLSILGIAYMLFSLITMIF